MFGNWQRTHYGRTGVSILCCICAIYATNAGNVLKSKSKRWHDLYSSGTLSANNFFSSSFFLYKSVEVNLGHAQPFVLRECGGGIRMITMPCMVLLVLNGQTDDHFLGIFAIHSG